MPMKKFSLILLIIIALASCAKHSKFEKEASRKAVEIAQTLVATDHSDTLAMQNVILQAEAVASEYALINDSLAVEAFHSSFCSYLRDNDPQLANEICDPI